MTPRKEVIGDCELWLGDCMDLYEQFDTSWAVMSDVPYGINLHGSFNASSRRYPGGRKGIPAVQYVPRIIGDNMPFDPLPWLAFAEVLLWGGNHYASRLPDGGTWLVWDKRGPAIPPRTQADCEIAWLNKSQPARMFRHVWDGMVRDSERGEERQHPTQKPIALMRWCLGFITGHTILDPFMGVGTTALACISLGRSFVGCEIWPAYFDMACRRIEAAYKQPDLFIEQARRHAATQQPLFPTPAVHS